MFDTKGTTYTSSTFEVKCVNSRYDDKKAFKYKLNQLFCVSLGSKAGKITSIEFILQRNAYPPYSLTK